MAGFASDSVSGSGSGSGSDSEYSYNFTASDEETLWAIVDRLSASSPRNPRNPNPVSAGRRTPATPTRNTTTIASSPFSPFDPDASLAIDETIAAITDEDLSFDISELNEYDDDGRAQDPARVHHDVSRSSTPEWESTRLAPPFAAGTGRGHASFVSKPKPRPPLPALLPGPDVRYPDLSRALSDAQETARLFSRAEVPSEDDDAKDKPSPLIRFRTFPMKTLSVSDLTAGSWCELQHFYALTRLPGGRKTRTAAMKRGSRLHEKLEREVFRTVQVEVEKREDGFGLKLWNMIQGLRLLQEQGATREFEVWGMVEGHVVNGVIDGLSYENPDAELQDDVFSSRGSSQTITNSQPYEPSTPGDSEIFITDVKTRNSAYPPRQEQVRGSIIQLFLYHRFLSDMAAHRLDYLSVFKRYGLNPDEPFSDSFMVQIGAVHEEVFAEPDADADAESLSTVDSSESSTGSDSEFVSAPCSPSQLSFASSSATKTLQYCTLRTLLPLLQQELRLTFPRGAADIGKIVAVEYRYRGRDEPTPHPAPPAFTTTTTTTTTTDPNLDPGETDPFQPPTSRSSRHGQEKQAPDLAPGSVICTNTFFVEPETLDLFLAETMRWWKGERPPRGAPPDEAAFKCRSCEFREACEWRAELDRQALSRARDNSDRARRGVVGGQTAAAGGGGVDVAGDGVGDTGDGGGVDGVGVKDGESGRRRRGRPSKGDKEKERKLHDIEDGCCCGGGGVRCGWVKRQ
ncbi:hypothetical protein N658DRAFT_568001 [Parathielavia hyrcaniae]|uniref:Defects in morphology protein 1 n=1 Tax=Parathielavia hyrcaniae TaxID=113614 RepID=A0AAN6PXE7_9PEZI|nr:hypothetical protein N658DRAFT_568001 [Parathielavia hyrcaniae]